MNKSTQFGGVLRELLFEPVENLSDIRLDERDGVIPQAYVKLKSDCPDDIEKMLPSVMLNDFTKVSRVFVSDDKGIVIPNPLTGLVKEDMVDVGEDITEFVDEFAMLYL